MGLKKFRKSIRKTTEKIANEVADFAVDVFDQVNFVDKIKKIFNDMFEIFKIIGENMTNVTDVFQSLYNKTEQFFLFLDSLDDLLLTNINFVFSGIGDFFYNFFILIGKLGKIIIKKLKIVEIFGYISSFLFIIYSLSIFSIGFFIFSIFLPKNYALMAGVVCGILSFILFFFLSSSLLDTFSKLTDLITKDNEFEKLIKKVIKDMDSEIKNLTKSI